MGNIKNSLAKLYPVYFMMTIVFFMLQLVAIHKPIVEMLYSLIAHTLLVQNMWYDRFVEPLNSPTWFLSAYFFNLVAFVVMMQLYCKQGKNVTYAFIVLYVFFYFVVIAMTGLCNDYPCYFFAPMRFFDFLIGYSIANFIIENKVIVGFVIKCKDWIEIFCLLLCALVYSSNAYMVLPSFISRDLIYVVPLSMLMVVLCILDNEKTPVGGLLKQRWIMSLGNLSMGIYIYHFLFVRIFVYLFPDFNKYISLLVVITASIVASFYSQKYFEKRTYNWIVRHL